MVKTSAKKEKNTTKLIYLSLCCIATTIILMLLPYGVVNQSLSRKVLSSRSVHSYFEVSYGNWFPIITALLSIIVLIMLVVKTVIRINKNDVKYSFLICIFLSICIVASPLSWLIYGGIYTITWIGAIVFILHIITLILQSKFYRASKKLL